MKATLLGVFSLWAVLAVAACPARADVFMERREDGTIVFTDTPSTTDPLLLIKEGPRAKEKAPALADEDGSWKTFAKEEAERSNLDPRLVRAVIYVESGENPDAVSNKGAIGLMQLMPSTAKDLGLASHEVRHPLKNIRGGVTYLAQMMTRFNGNIRLALAAYNAGPGAVEKYRGVPPFPETQEYVRRVLEVYRRFPYDVRS